MKHKNGSLRTTLGYAGILGCVWMAGIFIYMLVAAFLHPSKSVVMDINRFGEALPEVIILPVILMAGVFGVVQLVRKKL